VKARDYHHQRYCCTYVAAVKDWYQEMQWAESTRMDAPIEAYDEKAFKVETLLRANLLKIAALMYTFWFKHIATYCRKSYNAQMQHSKGIY
jgi:hypothetical protein